MNQWIPAYFGEIDQLCFLPKSWSRLQWEDVNVHKWSGLPQTKIMSVLKKKELSLDNSKLSQVFWHCIIASISFIHVSHKTWKIYGKSQGGWLFFPGGCIISHWQTRQKSSPQNIVSPTARFPKYRRSPAATRVPLAELWEMNSGWMDQGVGNGWWILWVIRQTA